MASQEKRVRSVPIYTVDAFTSVPFQGNQAAVCPLPTGTRLEDDILQKIAAEMNIAETAFVKTFGESDEFESGTRFGLRWFTPTVEAKLCGHATLATAAVIFNKLKNPSPSLTFETLSGDLIVSQDGDFIVMDFPTGVCQKQVTQGTYGNLIKTLFPDQSVVEDVEFCPSLQYLLVRLRDGWTRETFEQWVPALDKLESTVPAGQLIGVVVTCTGSPEAGYSDSSNQPYDFVSRFFAPWAGIIEDPVTGSAHTILAYYWSQRLGKTDMYGRQCSKRGGDVWMSLDGDRVRIRGKATFVLDGKLYL